VFLVAKGMEVLDDPVVFLERRIRPSVVERPLNLCLGLFQKGVGMNVEREGGEDIEKSVCGKVEVVHHDGTKKKSTLETKLQVNIGCVWSRKTKCSCQTSFTNDFKYRGKGGG